MIEHLDQVSSVGAESERARRVTTSGQSAMIGCYQGDCVATSFDDQLANPLPRQMIGGDAVRGNNHPLGRSPASDRERPAVYIHLESFIRSHDHL
jgi:hypothetical protein